MFSRKLSILLGSVALIGSALLTGATAEAAPASVQDAFPSCAPVIGNDGVRVTIRNDWCGRTIKVSVIWYHHYTGATWASTCYPIAQHAAQSFRYPSSVYDFDYPDPVVGIPQLGPPIAEARRAGLIAEDETERLYTFRLYGDWKGSANWR